MPKFKKSNNCCFKPRNVPYNKEVKSKNAVQKDKKTKTPKGIGLNDS